MSNNIIDQQIRQEGVIDIKSNAVKYGIIGGLSGIIVSLILFFLHMQFEVWAKWLQTFVMLSAIILGIRAIAEDNKNIPVPFGSLFKGGMIITLIVAVISIVYFLVYTNFIETDFVDKILDVSRQKMADKGLSEEQIDTAVEMTKKFMSPIFMTIIALVSNLIIGAVTSVICAAIFKKED